MKEQRAFARERALRMSDEDLAGALVMILACDEPLRTSLGMRSDRDCMMAIGFSNAVIQYSGLTYKQRIVARRMVAWAMVATLFSQDQTRRVERLGA